MISDTILAVQIISALVALASLMFLLVFLFVLWLWDHFE